MGDLLALLLGFGVIAALVAALLLRDAQPPISQAPAESVGGSEVSVAPVPTDHLGHDLSLLGKQGSLRLAALSQIPKTRMGRLRGCFKPVDPLSPEAQEARAKGWHAIGDEQMGAYRVVLIVSGAHKLQGDRCVGEGASLLIFLNGTVRGVVYDKRKPTDYSSFTSFVKDGSDLRLGSLDGALAELRFTDSAVSLDQLPEYDSACSFNLRIPRLERLPLVDAESSLFNQGWNRSSSIAELAEKACTRSSPCSRTYRSQGGSNLIVETYTSGGQELIGRISLFCNDGRSSNAWPLYDF